jgi:XTP/dITP diphosphohydrolase
MDFKDIIIATKNRGKVEEFKLLFKDYFENIYSLLDFDSTPGIVEDQPTFAGNALKKAEIIGKYFNKVTLSDDSGLVVEALNGAPGTHSARYAGENATDDDNLEKLLGEMNAVTNRRAKFVCALALVFPEGKKEVFEGECEGLITEFKRGTNGFGYDPVFYISRYDKTMAELDPDLKNMISHRSNAVKKLINYLKYC